MNKLIQVTGFASTNMKIGTMTESQEKISLALSEGPTTEIACELGYTKNLGNYQSAKLMVSLKAPSNLDVESLDKTFEFVKNWCEDKLLVMIEEMDKELKG